MGKRRGWWFSGGLLLGAFLGFVFAAKLTRRTYQPGEQELKLSVHNLRHLDDKDSPQLREYLKGRVYALVAYGNRSEWVDDEIDYGPLDRKILRGLSVVKGPDSDEDLYRNAIGATEGRAKLGEVSTAVEQQ